jgi:PAS domain S-box-containing protein
LSETAEVGFVARFDAHGHDAGEPARREERRSMATKTDVRTEEFMLDYLDNAVVGLHWVDGEANILWANKADYEPLGYTEDEYVGHNITEFHADADVINDILQRLLGGQSLYNYKARLLCKDGSTKSVLIASSGLFDDDDSFVHTRCFTIEDPSAT